MRHGRVGAVDRVPAGSSAGSVAGLLAALADLVLPRTCAGCGIPGAVLCDRCVRWLVLPQPASPRRFPPGLPPTVAAGCYAGPIRAAVVAFKERGRAELARPLGTALALAVAGVLRGLADAVPAGLPGPVLLVPVPSSAAGLRSRGRDHVRELCARAARELAAAGVPAREARLLRRRGRVRDSAGLSAVQRRANLAGSFAPRAEVPAGAVLVLVDDVVTTGATLAAAATALRAAGAASIIGVALARAE